MARPQHSAVVAAEDVQRGKPHPETYATAARRLGRDAAECSAIEDTVAGVRAAVAAGMVVVGVTGTASANALADAGAHRVVGSLEWLSPTDL